ncbi:DNA-dependent protein kinase catalytic subunit [Ixodes scapularis]
MGRLETLRRLKWTTVFGGLSAASTSTRISQVMSEQIREALQRLNASDHLAEALPLAEEVERTCVEQSFSVKDLGYVTSLLAGDAQSLVSFLKKHVATDQLKDAKAKSLNILTGWFERVPASQLLHHALAIKDVSCQLLFRDKAAKVRLQALVLLSKVLEACKGASVCTELDVPGLVERMFMLLSQPSKLTPTVKEEILCVLGTIAECHQVATEPYRDKLLALYLAELQAGGTGCFTGDVSCQLLFRDKAAKVRLQALVLLSKVLEACKGASVCTELDVPGLVERMFMLLSQPSKLTPTVKEEILCVLGTIAECHQVATEPYRDKLLALYLAELQRVCSVKEKNVVAGCLQGLSGFLFHFGTCFEDDPDNCFKLFKCVKRSLTPSDRPGRYDIPRAALILLSKHAVLFGQLLLDDHRTLYQQLGHWSRHGNRELQSLGTAALESFLREVASALVEHADRQDYLDIFQFFIKDFQRTLKMETSNHGLAAALKGYGLFALPCKRYLKEADVLYMLNDVLLRSEHVFQSISSHAVLEDSLPLLSSFQEATASILRCTGQVPASQLALLEKLTVLQIENFPLVAQNLQMRYCKSLLFVLLAVYPISRSSLSQIVYQGLVRTCSHPIAAQVEASREDDGTSQSRTITYRRYNFLWAYLLNAIAVQELNQMQISLDARQMLVRDVYDGLLSSALSVVSKLNLSVRQQASSDDGEARVDVSDPTCGIEAQCPKDFNIFINLVDFFRDTFTKKHLELFAKWAFVVVKQMVEYSARHPLVSGFYKVVAASIGICERSSYFEQPSGEAVACLRLVSGLLRDVLGRLQQLKDDLLASCLELVLGTPLALVREHARALVPAVRMALQQGLSYLPLAKASLDALRLWEKQLPADVADDVFRQVLPGLCPYLALGVRAGITEPAESTKRARSQGRHKVSLKLLYQKKRDQIKVPETESLRLDVLSFLGGLQGHRRALLLADLERDTLKAALAWDPETKEHLVFALPFPDTKLEIALDAFLPRVVELARFAGDRQSKVAGCELLHAMVLYAVGTGVQTSAERRAKFPMVHLFKHLFPELLHLACDVDQVTQRLFRPLVLQLMHWFSSGSTRGSRESVAIVECLWDTVTQPQETVLKDFAARCLREFVQWGIKQSTPKELEKGPTNVQSVLRRLCSYCRHPSALKRLGAALVFNNLYVLLREEESLVDVFILDILAHFVDSLKLAHSDERTIGTRELSGCALDSVLRIVSTKSELLNRPNVKRKWPSDTGGEPVVLSTAVRWLLLQTSRPQADCRHKCMELVHALIPKLPGAPSHQSYMSSLLQGNSPGFFVESFEGNLAASEGPWATLSAVCKFCDQLLGLLECYTWIFEQRLLEPKNLFEVPKKPSGLFGMVDHFLEHLAVCESPQELLRDVESEPLTSSKLSAFNLAKCSVTVRLFNFLATWMETSHGSMASVANPFWRSRAFWRCTVVCVLSPSDAGFDLTDLEVANQLPNEMLRFLNCVSKTFPKLLADDFVGAHADLVDHRPECGLDKVLAMPLTNLDCLRNDLLKWIGLASGYRLLAELRIIRVPDLLAARALVRSLAELLGSRGADWTPLGKELCLRVLELAAALGAQARDVLEALLPSQAWEVLGAQLCRHFAERASDYVPAALALAEGAPKMLTTVMSHMLQDKELTSRRGSELSLEVMRCWPSMERFWSEGISQDVVNGALHMLEKLVPQRVPILNDSLEYSSSFSNEVERPWQIRDALEEMVAQHFPLDSSTLLPGAPEYLCYVSAMRKMVAGLERSGSPVLLELLIRVLYRERGSHFLEAEVLLALQRTLTRQMLRFLKCVSKTFPKLLADNFVGAHTDFVDHRPECGLDKVLAMPLTNLDCLRNDLLKWIGLASGYRLLAELRIIRVPDLLAARALVRSLAERLGSRGADLTPLDKELCFRVLELAAALGAQARDVLEALLPSRAWEVLGAQLCRHFAERASDYVPAALALPEGAPKVLTTVMSLMLQDKELTSRRGSELSLEVMRCWPSMERFWSEGTSQDVVNGALHMLEKLVLLAPEVGSPKGPHFERLFGVFLKLLERSGATLADKVLVLDLLPVFASDIRPDTGLKLRDALEEMVAQHFPLDSSTLLPGAPEYLCYVSAMRKMVAGLERSGSPVLLELLIRVLYRERGSHFLEAEVLLALQRTLTRCGETKQQQLIEAAYKCGATNQGLLISARLSLASKLLPLLLKSCSKPALHRFFVDNVTAMVDAVAAKIRHGSESELTSKIVALSCLEVLYSCCLKDDVTGKQSSVNAAFCRSRGIVDVVGNELTKEITKHANSAKKEVVRRDVEFADLWRQLRCAAYRLVVAVVSCTQTESQFYDVFVFQERPEKGEFLWNNLVDEKAVYTFPLEREVLFQKSRHVVGVTEGQVPSPSFSGRMAGSLRGSSLAQEASQYSLSASGLAFWDVETVDSDSSKGTQAPAKEPVSRLKVMDLEDDALNGHECMASVCAVLCRMADLGIIPQTADEVAGLLRRGFIGRGSELSLEVMRCWPSMERFWSEGTSQDVVNGALHMLEKLVLLAPEVGSPKGPHFERLFGVFLKLLERSGATLADKVLVLDLLPVFASDIRPDTGLKLRDALEEMVAQHFPLDSSTLLPGAPEYLCYMVAGLERSGSPVLLELLIRVLYRERGSHFLEAEVLLALQRTLTRCGETKQQQLIEAAYKCGATNQGLLISARLSLASKLLPLLLKSCSKPALHRFFVDNVTAMVDAVAAKIRHGSESELTSKIVALSCLEVLYSCCPKDDVTGKQSSVNAAFCRSRGIVDVVGNELTKEITKHANSAKKEVVRRDVEFADLWRQLRCAAYRLVVAVVSCTQTESQFYDVFVFQERPEKGEFLWNNLVDEKAVYTFPLEREVRSVLGIVRG